MLYIKSTDNKFSGQPHQTISIHFMKYMQCIKWDKSTEKAYLIAVIGIRRYGNCLLFFCGGGYVHIKNAKNIDIEIILHNSTTNYHPILMRLP